MKTIIFESIPLLRDALLLQLDLNEHITELQPVHDASKIVSILEISQPDLLWLDGSLPGVKDAQLLKAIRQASPQTKILLFGLGETIPEIKNYFKHGILAYLPKTSGPDDIQAALDSLAADRHFVPSSLNSPFTNWITAPVQKKKRGHQLTSREKEVLSLIVEEHTTGEIAQKLFISYCTVETHRVHLIQKLGVKNTAGLVRVAFEAGLYGWSVV